MAILLILTVFLPLIGAIVLMASSKLDARRARAIALGFVVATLALSLVLLSGFAPGKLGPQFGFEHGDGSFGFPWMGPLGVRFALGIDGVSLWLFVLTSLLMITAVFSSWESIKDRAATHYALLLALQTGLLGLFASLDVVLFYIFFEFTLIPLFFLIGLYGGPERRRASVTFFLYTLAGSLLTLLGVIALVGVHYQYTGILTFSLPQLTSGLATLPWDGWFSATSWTSPQVLIFLLLFAGFAIKVPMFPFHTWLPLAHVEAPTAGSILLAGVMLKVGGYGLFRFNLSMTPLGAEFLFPLLAGLSVIGILYGALAALAQTDVKRLVAYSSVSHMGFIVLGLFSLNGTGMDGAVIQMLNHGVTTGALFACVGVVYERYHTREMAEIGGLWNWSPLWAFFIILASLGSAAVPLLNGFVGEFPILLGMYRRSPVHAVLAAVGMVLGAYYLLWMLQRVVFGPLKEPNPHTHDAHANEVAADAHGNDAHGHGSTVRPIGWHEIAGLSPLMVLIVVIGVYPKPFFDRLRPAVTPVVANIAAEQERAKQVTSPSHPLMTKAAIPPSIRSARPASSASTPPPPRGISL